MYIGFSLFVSCGLFGIISGLFVYCDNKSC